MDDASHDVSQSNSQSGGTSGRSGSAQSVSDTLSRTAREASEKVSELYSSGKENVKRMSDEAKSQPKPHYRAAPTSSSRPSSTPGRSTSEHSSANTRSSIDVSSRQQSRTGQTTTTRGTSAQQPKPIRRAATNQSAPEPTRRYAHGGDASDLKNGSRLKQTDAQRVRQGTARHSEQTAQHYRRSTQTSSTSKFSAALGRIPKPALCAIAAVLVVLVVWGCWNLVSSRSDDEEETDYDVTAAVSFDHPISTSETAWAQGEVPYLYQIDERWADEAYAGGTVAQYGSGPASLAMVYICLTGNTDMGIVEMCELSTNNGYATDGGTSWTYMVYAASYLGLTPTELELSYSDVEAALEAGEPVILKMGHGTFANEEGYIVLTGIDDDGMVEIRDPSSAYNTVRRWSLKKLLKEADAGWSYTY